VIGFSEQEISIKLCVIFSLEMEHGAFSMIPKADDKVCTNQESSYVEITDEANALHFVSYQGYCSL
jgi:hypothetical protein